MKIKTISITVFSIFICLMFSFLLLLTIPWLYGSQHQSIAFLGIFLVVFTIPVILYILIKKVIKPYIIVCYFLYFLFTSIVNMVFSEILQDMIFFNVFPFEYTYLTRFFNPMPLFLYLLFFAFQLPIIISCFMIKNIYRYNDTINLKYFLKNPLVYIFIVSLSLFPLILFNF